MVGRVIAYLVHELRSPVTVIDGYAQLALRADPQEVPELIESVRRGAHELERRIAALGDVRDVRRGAMRLSLEEVDVGGSRFTISLPAIADESCDRARATGCDRAARGS